MSASRSTPARVRAVQERRRSNAAGPHRTRRTKPKGGRAGARRAAIAASA